MLVLMDIAAIVRLIDAELDKLRTVRGILTDISTKHPVDRPSRKSATTKTRQAQSPSPPAELPMAVHEARATVLPPKVKRSYGPRIKPVSHEPKALSAPMSDRPVFVPKATASTQVSQPGIALVAASQDLDAMEAALRRNLLGGPA